MSHYSSEFLVTNLIICKFSYAYIHDKFCETFHSKSDGWRHCDGCKKVSWQLHPLFVFGFLDLYSDQQISELQILFYIPKILFYLPLILTNNWQRLHCGCIMSCHIYTELDYGGVGCSKCLLRSKKSMESGEVISDVCVFMTCKLSVEIWKLICSKAFLYKLRCFVSIYGLCGVSLVKKKSAGCLRGQHVYPPTSGAHLETYEITQLLYLRSLEVGTVSFFFLIVIDCYF